MESKIYNQKGKETGKISLPESIFGLAWNADLVHQVVLSMQSNARETVAHTKTRGEVSGTGKKPWKQKGTGRARHGSMRSPIWVGGGVAHGPRNDKNYSRKINRKMKAKALFTIMSKKFRDGEILFVDSLAFSEPKTKIAKEALVSFGAVKGFEKLPAKRKNSALITTTKSDRSVTKSFSNFGNVEVEAAKDLNPLKLLQYKYLVITDPAEAVKFFEGKMPAKAARVK